METKRRRFLVLTFDGGGNWPPELALIRALLRRGHEVRVISNPTHEAQIVSAGAEYRPYKYVARNDPTVRRDCRPESEMARSLQEIFLNPKFCDELLAEVDRSRPDVLLVDCMLLTGAAAAESTRLPTAMLWHTVYGALANGPRRTIALDPLNTLREKMSLPPVKNRWECLERTQAILALTYEAFDTIPTSRPGNLHYVGPLACVSETQPPYSLPWAYRDNRPLILVSYSTSFQDQVQTLQRVANAVADLPARVLMTLGPAVSSDELQLPDNVQAESYVPHAVILPHTNLLITHAGHGTVMAAVTAGVPMVCTPMGRDQHIVSECVKRRKLGLVVPMTASPAELRSTIEAALKDEALHVHARTFATGLDVEGGMCRALKVLEELGLEDRTEL